MGPEQRQNQVFLQYAMLMTDSDLSLDVRLDRHDALATSMENSQGTRTCVLASRLLVGMVQALPTDDPWRIPGCVAFDNSYVIDAMSRSIPTIRELLLRTHGTGAYSGAWPLIGNAFRSWAHANEYLLGAEYEALRLARARLTLYTSGTASFMNWRGGP